MLSLTPIDFKSANAFVEKLHRHHGPVVRVKFSIGAVDDSGELRGVVMVGRPVARGLDDGWTVDFLSNRRLDRRGFSEMTDESKYRGDGMSKTYTVEFGIGDTVWYLASEWDGTKMFHPRSFVVDRLEIDASTEKRYDVLYAGGKVKVYNVYATDEEAQAVCDFENEVDVTKCSCTLVYSGSTRTIEGYCWQGSIMAGNYTEYFYVRPGAVCPVCGGVVPPTPPPYGVDRFGPAVYRGDDGGRIDYKRTKPTTWPYQGDDLDEVT